MDTKAKIERARDALNTAVHMNLSIETILKLSQIIDQYIVEYYREIQKIGLDEKKNTKTCSCNSGCVIIGNE